MKKGLRRLLLSVSGALVLAGGAAGASARRVASDEMAPSIQRGEWVFLLPVEPIRGDVVALPDPLDPERIVLRRAIAGPRQRIKYEEDGTLRVEIKKIRQKEMGTDGEWRILEETMWSKPPARANTWLLRRRVETVRWADEPSEVPEGHWFVLADDRDGSLDSRWWGPVPVERMLGVVRLRIGRADAWRGAVQWLKPIP